MLLKNNQTSPTLVSGGLSQSKLESWDVHSVCFSRQCLSLDRVCVTRSVMGIHIIGIWRLILLQFILCFIPYILLSRLFDVPSFIWWQRWSGIIIRGKSMLPFEFSNHQELWIIGDYVVSVCSSIWQCTIRERKFTALFKLFEMKCIGLVQLNKNEILIRVLMKKLPNQI